MAIVQPISTDTLTSKNHALMHRVVAIDSASPVESIVVDSAGNVGIGTTTPAQLLDVRGTSAALQVKSTSGATVIADAVDASDASINLRTGGVDAVVLKREASTHDFVLFTQNTERLRVSDATGDVYTNAWADYSGSSTITGWSSLSVQTIYTKKIGKMVYVNFILNGTSNSIFVSFTLPYTIGTGAGIGVCGGQCQDNTTTLTNPSLIQAAAATALVNVYKDLTGASWTASGNKIVTGQFFYQSA